jgi:hypothetical protein
MSQEPPRHLKFAGPHVTLPHTKTETLYKSLGLPRPSGNQCFNIDTHLSIIMHFTIPFIVSLCAVASAKPIPDPISMITAAGPAAGVVITKCSAPGQLALAYDDGPYQYTQKLVDTLTAGGAKGTFFVTGTLYGQPSARGILVAILIGEQDASMARRLHYRMRTKPATKSRLTPGLTRPTSDRCRLPT